MSCDNYPSKKDVEDFALNAKVINEFTTESGELTTSSASDGKQKITLAEIWRQANEESVTSKYLSEYVMDYTWHPWTVGDASVAGRVYEYTWHYGRTIKLVANEDGATLGDTPDFSVFSVLSSVIDAQDYGAAGNGVNDDTDALNFFFAMIRDQKIERFKIHGTYLVSEGVTIESGGIAVVDCQFKIKSTEDAEIDSLLTIYKCSGAYFSGLVSVEGNGSYQYGTKKVRTGIAIRHSRGCKFDKISSGNFWEFGIEFPVVDGGNNTLTDLGSVKVNDCGTYISTGDRAAVFSWSNRIDSGSAGSTSQRTTITASMIPDHIKQYDCVYIAGEVYIIDVVDHVAKSITLFSWIDLDLLVGDGSYIIGAGIKTFGSDCGILNFNMIDAVRCGRALWSCALYNAYVKRLVSQFNFIGYQYGDRTSSANTTEQLDNFYTEGDTLSVYISTTYAQIGVSIYSNYALDLSKIRRFTPRLASNEHHPSFSHLSGMVLRHGNDLFSFKQLPSNSQGSTESIAWDTRDSASKVTYVSGGGTYRLSFNEDLNRLYGLTSHTVIITTSGAGNLGNMSFITDDGWTINSLSEYIIAGESPAVQVIFVAHVSSKNWLPCVINMTR